LPSNGPGSLCWAHDPKNAERRRRGQSRGGKNKPSRELVDVKRRLSELAEGVLEGRVEKGTAAVVSQIWNTYIRAIATSLKAREVEELESRLEELESLLERRDEGGRRWMGMKGRIGRLEKRAERDIIEIPQQDGTGARFPQRAAADAFVNLMDRLGAGEEAPPEHPLLEAATNSSDRWWREAVYAVEESWTDPVPDLSE